MSMNTLLQRAQELPQPPRIMQDLIASFNNPNVDIDEITRKITMDQVISAKVLRLANSARFGAHRNVTSINEAVIRLGFNAVRTLVLASGMVASIQPPPSFDARRFWGDSFTVANISKWLAGYGKLDQETAFTCGMMHSIGQLLIHCFMADDARAIDEVVSNGADRLSMERSRLGFDHLEMGRLLAERWQFPAVICESISTAIVDEEDCSDYAALVQIAEYLHRSSEDDIDEESITAGFPSDLADHLKLDQVYLLADLAMLEDMSEGVEEILS